MTLGSVGRIGLRFGALGLNAVAFGVAARHLTPSEMGIWALATTLTSVVMSLDLGLSSHLRNRLMASPEEGESLFSSAVLACVVVAVLLGVAGAAFAIVSPSVQALPATLFWSLALGSGLLLLRLPLNPALNSFYSFREPMLPIVWEFVGFGLALLFLAGALVLQAGVIAAVLAYLGGGVLATGGAFAHLLVRRRWRLRGGRPRTAGRLVTAGWRFGALQIIGLGLASLPGFVVGALAGLEEVPAARGAMVLCQTVLSLHLAHAMPIWTDFSALAHRGDAAALHELQRRLRREALLLLVAFSLLVVVSPWIIDAWLGRRAATLSLAAAFGLWGLGMGLASLYSLVLNGGDRPLATAFALVPGALLALLLARPAAAAWQATGVALAFAAGALLSAALMSAAALRLLRASARQ